MKFRPCIDIHNGKVKQIVGSSLKDNGDLAEENFVSDQRAASYALLYRRNRLTGGHMILLNPPESRYYEENVKQALEALEAYPGGLQVGGGITAENAAAFIDAGASHVIVTSYVFREGKISYENLEKISQVVGKKHLVLDVSCRKKGDGYYIVTDRWQTFTKERLTMELLERLHQFCDEFLVHGVDVEGKSTGVEKELLQILSGWNKSPLTYAGGIRSLDDIEVIADLGKGRIDFTVGSALDLFGGCISYSRICENYSDE